MTASTVKSVWRPEVSLTHHTPSIGTHHNPPHPQPPTDPTALTLTQSPQERSSPDVPPPQPPNFLIYPNQGYPWP